MMREDIRMLTDTVEVVASNMITVNVKAKITLMSSASPESAYRTRATQKTHVVQPLNAAKNIDTYRLDFANLDDAPIDAVNRGSTTGASTC
ncbi:hypothetical protein FACS189472_13120 [Alphaproteobacteria bacterium]|nr:hypothetical protein FACS189472_13120 [Alphaproteobacteria bacterium]